MVRIPLGIGGKLGLACHRLFDKLDLALLFSFAVCACGPLGAHGFDWSFSASIIAPPFCILYPFFLFLR